MCSFLRHDLGDTTWIEWVQADPLVEISDRVLEGADRRFVSVGDGIVTFHCRNGDISYGLRDHDEFKETWLGVRSDIDADEDLGAHTREG